MANLKYWIWLTQRRELAGQGTVRLLEHFGSPERVYFADEEEYRQVDGLPESALQSLNDKALWSADKVLGDCDRLGIRVVTLQDAVYPERLAAIHQPPLVLYVKGRPVSIDQEAAIAIVGTRDATPYGLETATRLSMDLARAGAVIVSGLAEGIDTAAVRGALQAGGSVVSVLAGGLDIVYPKRNRDLYEDLSVVGTLVSEYPPGTPHRGAQFPVRNRIISGLSAGVIAVESKRSGGSLLTVGHALDQDREVFAVPGPIGAPASEGTNRLIQEGAAKLILGADDVLCELIDRFPGRLHRGGFDPNTARQRMDEALREDRAAQPAQQPVRKKEVDSGADSAYIDWLECKKKLADDQCSVLLAFEGRSLRADELVELTQLPARRVLSALTILQVQGLVTEQAGKQFRLTGKLKME